VDSEGCVILLAPSRSMVAAEVNVCSDVPVSFVAASEDSARFNSEVGSDLVN
jgi:hypothetical protein